jgi:hypothetical protein
MCTFLQSEATTMSTPVILSLWSFPLVPLLLTQTPVLSLISLPPCSAVINRLLNSTRLLNWQAMKTNTTIEYTTNVLLNPLYIPGIVYSTQAVLQNIRLLFTTSIRP